MKNQKLASCGNAPEIAVLCRAAAMQAAEMQQGRASHGYESAPVYSLAAETGAGGIEPVLQGQRVVTTATGMIEEEGGEVLGSEITIDAGGVRARSDLVIRDANGNLQFVEAKTGGGR